MNLSDWSDDKKENKLYEDVHNYTKFKLSNLSFLLLNLSINISTNLYFV